MHAHEVSEAPRRLASVTDVARLLGLPKSTIYTRAQQGAMPGIVRVGQRVLFDLSKLNAWIDAGGDNVSEPTQ